MQGRDGNEDYEMKKAIEESLKDYDNPLTSDKYYLEDFSNPDESKRIKGMPAGLKNIGNSNVIIKHSLLFKCYAANLFYVSLVCSRNHAV